MLTLIPYEGALCDNVVIDDNDNAHRGLGRETVSCYGLARAYI